jgi:methionyl-tRNA formyltransferase
MTILYLSEELDAGDIIVQKRVPIGANDTTGTLTARLAEEGAALLAEALRLIEDGRAPRARQDPALATWAPKLTRAEAEIDWQRPAPALVNLVRACDPWPGAFTWTGGQELKVWRASARGAAASPPGTVTGVPAGEGEPLAVAAGGGTIVEVHQVQPAGGRRMSAAAFVRGHRVRPGAVLGRTRVV